MAVLCTLLTHKSEKWGDGCRHSFTASPRLHQERMLRRLVSSGSLGKRSLVGGAGFHCLFPSSNRKIRKHVGPLVSMFIVAEIMRSSQLSYEYKCPAKSKQNKIKTRNQTILIELTYHKIMIKLVSYHVTGSQEITANVPFKLRSRCIGVAHIKTLPLILIYKIRLFWPPYISDTYSLQYEEAGKSKKQKDCFHFKQEWPSHLVETELASSRKKRR